MKKYSALGHYFANLAGDRITVTFGQIEEIIGASLPNSAFKHAAWWSNAKTSTHSWAHHWLSAGWAKEHIDFEAREVAFRRQDGASLSAKEALENLEPQTKETIYDLLEIAGISTVAWQTSGDSSPVKNVKSNPSYCYNWSFGSEAEGFSLCIWHDMLFVEGNHIIYEENLQDLARQLDAASRNSSYEKERRSRAAQQAARARTFDQAICTSYSRGLPIRVIVTRGDRRSREDLGAGSSHVEFRSLDPVKWYVHRYDQQTGLARLIRGVKPEGVVGDDAAPLGPLNLESGAPDEIQMRAIQTRRGQARFRERLLAVYGRRCAVTACGVVELLEAAHIRPHSDEPNYSVTNGLLLRADIHTLFDMWLLSIDPKFHVHLAPALMNSEYKLFDQKELKRTPELPSELPSLEALDRRHREFLEKHWPS